MHERQSRDRYEQAGVHVHVLVSRSPRSVLFRRATFLSFPLDLGTVNLAMVERAIGRRKTTSDVRIIATS